ncbi:hypothetical protein UlMin_019784 [Ulmus minor]
MAYVSMREAHRRITDYLNRFSDTVSSQDKTSLKLLLSLSSNSPFFLSFADALNVFQDATRLINQSKRFSYFFIQEFWNWDSAWALEALYVIAYEIRVLAERADRDLASNGKSLEKLKATGSFLMKVFGVLAISLGKGPKRVGALYVSCQLFKLRTVHLCRSVIRSIETACIFEFEEFPKRDKVTYIYYTIRLEVFNENFPAKFYEHFLPSRRAKIVQCLTYHKQYTFFSCESQRSCSWRHQGNQRLRIGVFLLVSMRFLLINMKKMVTKEDIIKNAKNSVKHDSLSFRRRIWNLCVVYRLIHKTRNQITKLSQSMELNDPASNQA